MGVLGINLRNAIINRANPRTSIRLVNDKYATKVALADQQVPVPGTIALINDPVELRDFDWTRLPDAWALKPNRGRRGEGIMLATERDGENWRTASGRLLTRDEITFHIERVLDGEHSLEGLDRDSAMFEPLIRPHPLLREIVPEGLPDTRIICRGDEPIMAMIRIPTVASDGKANLHQGAIGAGVEMETGRIFRAVLGNEEITHHPDTGFALLGLQVPQWDEVLAASTKCGGALDLGYCGADIVLDAERGPLVLECNAFPGLQIQNVNGRGLKGRIDELGLDRPHFWKHFRRAPRPHPHVISKEQSLRRLGPAPLHPGYVSTETILSDTGLRPFNLFSGFGKITGAPEVDPALAERAAEALRANQWEDRGVGEDGSMIVVTSDEQPLAIIGSIVLGEDGRAGFLIGHVSQLEMRRPKSRGDTRRRIFLVDDDDLLLDLVRYHLESKGYSVATASDGAEALLRLKVITPSAIVLDGDMPKLDGIGVLKHIRSDSRLSGTPVIMLTARRKAEQIVDALGFGADEYVTKPFKPEQLLDRLEKLLPRDG